jgi:hypothetical protein
MEAIKRMPRDVLQEFMKLLAAYECRELERQEVERQCRLH